MVFAAPDTTFTLNELVAKADAGRGGTRKQILKLIDAGVLVETSRKPRQRNIKLNTNHFLYNEFRSIVLKTFGLAEPLREALAPFRQAIEEAFVFGSNAKGTDTYKSDIDLIVIGTAPLVDLTEALLKVEESLGRQIHLSLYSFSEWGDISRDDPVMRQIAQAAKIEVIPYAKTA